MKYRALTVAREFGSGGGRIAQSVAAQLGWKLLDREFVTAVAEKARVDSRVVGRFDERVDSWLRRTNEAAIRGAAMAVAWPDGKNDIFDAKAMGELTQRLVEEAYAAGNCVIVGRGAQCLLQNKPDVFHVFVYAPLRKRVERLKQRLEPGADAAERLRTVDTERARYLRQHFGKSWCEPHLYDLMISTKDSEDDAARVILCAMSGND